jgi:hypothetical protein
MGENHQIEQDGELVAGLRARIKSLERTLGHNDLSLAMAYHLTPQLNNLLGLLMAQPIVTDDMVRDNRIATQPKVALNRLRKHLKSYGVLVQRKRILGFWLDNDTKETIRGKLRLAAGVAAVIELGAPHAKPCETSTKPETFAAPT